MLNFSRDKITSKENCSSVSKKDSLINTNTLNEKNYCNSQKPTVDNTIIQSIKSNVKHNINFKIEIDSLEELHFIYNNLFQQNKLLAKKFDNEIHL